MKPIQTVIEILGWVLATWLFVGLLGSMRWLSPAADASPDALLAIAIKLIALAVFVGVWALSARFGQGNRGPSRDALPYERAAA